MTAPHLPEDHLLHVLDVCARRRQQLLQRLEALTSALGTGDLSTAVHHLDQVRQLCGLDPLPIGDPPALPDLDLVTRFIGEARDLQRKATQRSDDVDRAFLCGKAEGLRRAVELLPAQPSRRHRRRGKGHRA